MQYFSSTIATITLADQSCRHSNHATGLPPAIPLNYCYGAREWALTTAEPDNRGDYQLACSLEYVRSRVLDSALN